MNYIKFNQILLLKIIIRHSSVLEHRKESRKRNLSFHLPLIIPFAPQVRIVQDDPSYCSLQDVYEDHCDNIKISKDEPIIFFINKMKANIGRTSTVRNFKDSN